VRLCVGNLLDCLVTVFADSSFSLVPLLTGEQLGELREEQGDLTEALANRLASEASQQKGNFEKSVENLEQTWIFHYSRLRSWPWRLIFT